METPRSTKAGLVFWTPAPFRTSPGSSVVSECEWEDGDEERAESDEDFTSQMDENGIIGLEGALDGVELGGTCGNAYAERSADWYAGRLTSGEADAPPGGPRCNLMERLSRVSPRDGVQIPSPCDDLIGGSKARTADEAVRQRRGEQRMRRLPDRELHLQSAEEEEDEEGSGTSSDGTLRRSERTRNGSPDGYIPKGETEFMSSTKTCSAPLLVTEPAGDSGRHCPVSQHAPPSAVSFLPHLLHLAAEEIAAAPGIEAETFPELSFTESLPETHGSHSSLKSSPRSPEVTLRVSPPPAGLLAGDGVSDVHGGVSKGHLKGPRPTPSPRKTRRSSPEATDSSRSLGAVRPDLSKSQRQATCPDREPRTPRARSNAAGVDETRKGPLNHRTPDFSKVEPRVRFPKGDYTPPKSKRPSKKESLSPEPPLVFKSPADIVKEVLLNVSDGAPATSDSRGPPASAPNFTVPQEFRSRQNATMLLEQLQENYKTLLIRYAEAENTIDRLRLEAKVNLHSDPPKPARPVQSGLKQGASRLMVLDFPQAQRAETSSASLRPDERSSHHNTTSTCPPTRSPDPLATQQAARILYSQADKFLQQLQTFEDLLTCRRLKPAEQVMGLPQLAEGLRSLERGYLLAKEEHKLRLQRDEESGPFDPGRELEALIFQCGLHVDELKERVKEAQRDQPNSEAPPYSSRNPTPPSAPTEGGRILIHPQTPPVPSLVDPGEAAAAEVSSASEESVGEEDREEETVNSFYLRRLTDSRYEQDDRYQSFKELPKPLAASRADIQPGDERKVGRTRDTGNVGVQESRPQRTSDHSDSPPQQTGRSSPHPSSLPPPLTGDPSSNTRKFQEGKTHSSSLSNLPDLTAPERGSSKLRTGSSGVLSQDGVISPETDSGFVGSDSSRLTLAAASSPLHQGVAESSSVTQQTNQGNPQTGPFSSFPVSRTATEPGRGSRLSPDQLRRPREVHGRRPVSSSPQRWVGQAGRSRVDSGTSELGLESDSPPAVSEDGQNGGYTESISSLRSSGPSSSPAARHHRHSNPPRALISSHAARRNDAIQELQAEVSRLQERLESCLRNKKASGSVRAAHSTQGSSTLHTTSTPRVRSVEGWSDVSRGRGEVEESAARRTVRMRPPSGRRQTPQPDISSSESSTLRPQPLVSRCTQTPAAETHRRCSHTPTDRSRTHTRQQPTVPLQVYEAADEPDSGCHGAPLCPQCASYQRGRPEAPAGDDKEPTRPSCCHHCPLCGRPQLHTSTDSGCHRLAHSPIGANQPGDGAARPSTAPPALLQCMPVCPLPLLLYSSPLYATQSHHAGTSSAVGGHEADEQRSVDSSLNKAIKAARHMRLTSGHMARSLASGLQYQQLLSSLHGPQH